MMHQQQGLRQMGHIARKISWDILAKMLRKKDHTLYLGPQLNTLFVVECT